jgi:hypothetical protein
LITQGWLQPAAGLLMTGTAETVMVAEPVMLPMVQVAIAEPAATPVTTFPETVKMELFEDWKGQSLRKTFGAGFNSCAESCEVAPTPITGGLATTLMAVAGVMRGLIVVVWAKRESGAHNSARAKRMCFMGFEKREMSVEASLVQLSSA